MCHLLSLLGAHHILHVSRVRVKLLGQSLLEPSVETFSLNLLGNEN